MKILSIALMAGVMMIASPVLFNNNAMAGGSHEGGHGHSHGPISSNKAISKATKKIQQLVAKGKLDKSWGDIQATSAEKKQFGKKTEWVVSFKNEKLADKEKQNLYIFFTLDGHYLATNFTGK